MSGSPAVAMQPPALFASPDCHGRELTEAEVPLLQALFDANPEYFLAINGRPANPDEAQVEFDERPPPHLPFGKRWFVGLFDGSQQLVGVTVVLSDFCAAGVWHVALLLLATHWHGRGVAGPIYAALERWMRDQGAQWLRLGVVDGNTRAERFWARCGFREVRVRRGVDTGGRTNDIRVLVKPLDSAGIDSYLQRVPRDQPTSTLP